ncbi:MAG: hypothetical protein JKY50_04255 [Oleispira sp.]|nr:hypothetical protein [Oleispira sp.]MBL4881790.1 hypothetical protein [Oleispira sp.]
MNILRSSILISAAILSGCGGDSSDSNDTVGLNDVTNVSGNYSMITSAISTECSDGSTATEPAIALSGQIIHTDNKVEFIGDDNEGTAGQTIIETDRATGIIESNGKFIITKVVLAQVEGIEGNLTYSFNHSGYFNDTGWSGDYQYSVFFHNLSASCTSQTTFYGTKS